MNLLYHLGTHEGLNLQTQEHLEKMYSAMSVTKMFMILLIMIKSVITSIIMIMIILAENKYQTERQLCLYRPFIVLLGRMLGLEMQL